MIDVNELWIGDVVRLKRSGRVGRFDGIANDGKIRVKLGEKIVRTQPANLEIAEESDLPSIPSPSKRPLQTPAVSATTSPSSTVIDLHIEVLNPSLINGQPERIISYQIDAARAFINQSIANHQRIVEIIHGKGQGVLRSEIMHLLSLYDEVNFTLPKNGGGSTEVWLKA